MDNTSAKKAPEIHVLGYQQFIFSLFALNLAKNEVLQGIF